MLCNCENTDEYWDLQEAEWQDGAGRRPDTPYVIVEPVGEAETEEERDARIAKEKYEQFIHDIQVNLLRLRCRVIDKREEREQLAELGTSSEQELLPIQPRFQEFPKEYHAKPPNGGNAYIHSPDHLDVMDQTDVCPICDGKRTPTSPQSSEASTVIDLYLTPRINRRQIMLRPAPPPKPCVHMQLSGPLVDGLHRELELRTPNSKFEFRTTPQRKSRPYKAERDALIKHFAQEEIENFYYYQCVQYCENEGVRLEFSHNLQEPEGAGTFIEMVYSYLRNNRNYDWIARFDDAHKFAKERHMYHKRSTDPESDMLYLYYSYVTLNVESQAVLVQDLIVLRLCRPRPDFLELEKEYIQWVYSDYLRTPTKKSRRFRWRN